MDQSTKIFDNEGGFVLVVALIIMVILSLIGIAGLNTSMFEEQIAGNDWNAKRSFYRADGGISLGFEVLEQNLNCPTGFTATAAGLADIKGTNLVPSDRHILVKEQNNNALTFYTNPLLDETSTAVVSKLDSPVTSFDVAYPVSNGALAAVDVGYLFFGGETNVLPGGALQMAAGYEGKGKAAGQGGVAKVFDIYSQFLGPKSSEAIILSGWRHLVGTEGSCIY